MSSTQTTDSQPGAPQAEPPDHDDLFSAPVLVLPRWITVARLEKALWTVPIVGVVVGAIMWAWTFDDGFIYFRTVDQLLAGNGPVFNTGERIESFTSPLWLTILTVGDAASPFRLEYTAAALSIGCTVAGLLAATWASARLCRSDRPGRFRIPIGLVVIAALQPFWVWSTSGLEVGLTFAWIGACFAVLMRWADRATAETASADQVVPRSALVLLGLGWLIRPELLLSSVLFVGVVVMMSTSSRRRRWLMIATAAAVPVAYEIFRMGYYGMLVSAPAIAKEGSVLRPARGWTYFTNFVGPYALVLPILALVFGIGGPLCRSLLRRPNRRPLVVAGVVAGSGALHMVSIILIGGDYVHARLFVPGLFALIAPFFVVAASRRYVEGLVVTAGWAVVCLIWLRPSDNPGDGIGTGFPGETLTYQDRGFSHRGTDQPWLQAPGIYVATGFDASASPTDIVGHDPDEIVVAAGAVGAFGYVLGPDARIVDLHGLAEPITGHQRLEFQSVPGHEKMAYGPWLIAMLAADPWAVQPDVIVTQNWWVPDPPPLDYLHDVAWASAALDCDAIDDLLATSTAPFGAGRFFSNVFSSVSNTTVRIDRRPRDAYVALCGNDIPPEVVEFYDRARFQAELPADAASGDLVVAGECAAVFLGTGDADDPWRAIEARSSSATVTMDPGDTAPALAAVFVAGPYGLANAVVWLETDGSGNYRVRQDVDWIPPAFQAWSAIPDDGIVRVTLSPDLATRQWSITSPAILPGLPMVSTVDDSSTVIVPAAAGPSDLSRSIDVAFDDDEPGPTCQALLDHGYVEAT